MSMDPRLDRRVPQSFQHVARFAASALPEIAATVEVVERKLMPPSPVKYQAVYDQGSEGACVGFGESITMSIINRKLYDARWLYREAQIVDEFLDTPPEEGTSLAAGFDILRTKGHRQLWDGRSRPPAMQEGIVEVNRWLRSVDEGRTAISLGKPIVDGVVWFRNFYEDKLVERKVRLRNGQIKTEWWIPEPSKWGQAVGGHCISRPIASDQRQAFGWLNSWGNLYPWPVYISYESHAKLMTIDGEQAIVTDR